MKSLSRRKGDDEGGRKPAQDGPGLQVDAPRAWGWPLSVAGAAERGQAGMSATRSAAANRRGAEEGDLGRAPEGREDLANCQRSCNTSYLWSLKKPCLLV